MAFEQLCACVCVYTCRLAHFVPPDNISMLIQGRRRWDGWGIQGVWVCLMPIFSAKNKKSIKVDRRVFTLCFLTEVERIKKDEKKLRKEERCCIRYTRSTPNILLSSLLSFSLQALNRIRASYAKWNVWRKPRPWNKAQETGRDRETRAHTHTPTHQQGRRCRL